MDAHFSDTYSWQPLPEKPHLSHKSMMPVSSIQKQVTAIAEEILKANNLKGKYSFFVFQSASNQVIHTKDRKIYIPTGLIKIAKNKDQLAHILAHEIAHWENGDMRDDRVKMPISQGQLYDAECHADEKAIQLLFQSKEINTQQVRKWLKQLKDTHNRDSHCEL